MIIGMVLPSYKQTGPVIVSSLIAKGVSDLDNNCSFVFISLRKNEEKASAWLKKTLEEKVCYYELGMGQFPNNSTLNKLRDIVKAEKIGIIHSHCYWPTVICSKIDTVRKIVTIHEQTKISLKHDYGDIISRLFIPMFVRAIKKYTKVIAVSDSTRTHILSLLKNFHVRDFSVILNGVEDSFTISESNKETGQIRFASFCNLTKNKNIMLAIKGFSALLKSNISNFAYDIYGDGPEYKKIRDYIRSEKIQKHVRLMGTIPREEVLSVFNEYNAIIALSFSEGLSLVAIESLMMGKPLLCSNIDSFKGIVDSGDNGYLFDNRELKDFTEKIANLLKNPDGLKELSCNARRRYLSQFTVKKMAEKYLDTYRFLSFTDK
jgi:glycosyltransferase involved in cell wall biosynthesis